MIPGPFKAGGALTKEHHLIYIERQAERDVMRNLQLMDYLLIIEPRQQGKTSLINYMMYNPAFRNVSLVYVDVTTPNRETEVDWYQTLCPQILRQLGFIPSDKLPIIPKGSLGWMDFLSEVAMLAQSANKRIVIALDEIGAVEFPGVTSFFSILRAIYNSRQAEPYFKQLTFVLTGSFHPRDLIMDEKISPFNIAQRVRLTDFTPAQVYKLVRAGGWSDEEAKVLSERIYFWVGGQPYLTQLLSSYLRKNATSLDVDTGIERIRQEDENHLPPIVARLNSDEKLQTYLDRIHSGELIKYYPRENKRQAQLELLGIIKANANGYCTIRNEFYKLVLSEYYHQKAHLNSPLKHKNEKGTLINLRLLLTKHYSKEELQSLCFDLGIDYDDLKGESKTSKAREIVSFLKRYERLPELINKVIQQRPNVSLEDIYSDKVEHFK